MIWAVVGGYPLQCRQGHLSQPKGEGVHDRGAPQRSSQGLQDICLNHSPLLLANLWVDLLDSNRFWLRIRACYPLSPVQFIMCFRSSHRSLLSFCVHTHCHKLQVPWAKPTQEVLPLRLPHPMSIYYVQAYLSLNAAVHMLPRVSGNAVSHSPVAGLHGSLVKLVVMIRMLSIRGPRWAINGYADDICRRKSFFQQSVVHQEQQDSTKIQLVHVQLQHTQTRLGVTTSYLS